MKIIIDFSKAFDTVDNNIFYKKLEQNDVTGDNIKSLENLPKGFSSNFACNIKQIPAN